MYLFCKNEPLFNENRLQFAEGDSHGVCHGDEMIYLFSSTLPHLRGALRSPQDLTTSKKMIKMWMNFVHTSNPTPNPGVLFYVKLYSSINFETDILQVPIQC